MTAINQYRRHLSAHYSAHDVYGATGLTTTTFVQMPNWLCKKKIVKKPSDKLKF